MSVTGENSSHTGFDASDHQAAYIFKSRPPRPTKKRKLSQPNTANAQEPPTTVKFVSLLNNTESDECVRLRQDLFQTSWAFTEKKIQSILSESNEDTLTDVTSFVQESASAETAQCIPTGFIVTGPNIASQALLFDQLSDHLQEHIAGPVVTLRSGDALNLKSALKKLIKDATNQRPNEDDEEGLSLAQDGRKLLHYDLEILHSHVKVHDSKRVVIAFQDTEAFDSSLLTDLISLVMSWLDRIPFVLLFGIATSVNLFHERLPRAATRCLSGSQFDVAQTSSVLERLFRKVIASSEAPFRLGPGLISSLLERQFDHVQSVQTFVTALKYAYMCHFYANPLTIFLDITKDPERIRKIVQPEHCEAIRNLSSFKELVEGLLDHHKVTRVRNLLEDDINLLEEIEAALKSRDKVVAKALRAVHILSSCTSGSSVSIDLYMKAFTGALSSSDSTRAVLNSVKYMGPDEFISLMDSISGAIQNGSTDLNLSGWVDEDSALLDAIMDIHSQACSLIDEAADSETPIRSKYSAHNKVLRTTVVAQKVQLSHDSSKLTKQDTKFTSLIDRLSQLLEECFTSPTPQDLFMNEIWLYDSKLPYRDVFTPKPRFAIERALSVPHDYLGCHCCKASDKEGLSSSQPATAILYQLYLETGSLINIFDLWSAFFATVGGEDGEGADEREALVLFYRALADLKLLGMVKQSKRKPDHLAKLVWKGM